MALLSCTNTFAASGAGISGGGGDVFSGDDLHLTANEAITYPLVSSVEDRDGGGHILVLQGDFSMSIGSQKFSSDNSVIWLLPSSSRTDKSADFDYDAIVYLQGNVSADKSGARVVESGSKLIEDKQMVVRFVVTGEVFITADRKESTDPRGLELYSQAYNLIRGVDIELSAVDIEPVGRQVATQPVTEKTSEAPSAAQRFNLNLKYPVNISSAGDNPIDLVYNKQEEKIATVIGRFYLSQQQENGILLELQADNAVIFLPDEQDESAGPNKGIDEILKAGALKAIYLTGDVVMTQGQRTVRADEIYYDFEREKALFINAVMRQYDTSTGIPIYVRAAKLQQLSAKTFAGENIVLTTSEFYVPQISVAAASVMITDETAIDRQQQDTVSKESFDVKMSDVQLKMYDKTILSLPYMRSNMHRPDVPVKSVHIGHDNTFGTYLETQWYLARLLGLQEPEGTDSTLMLDYYGDRGLGGGLTTDYAREDYFGKILGYIIDDKGQDRLGRNSSRKNLEPPHEMRGRFRWQHRHFLPYSWQLTTEISYISDENFIESYYRNEFNVDKEQETLVHLKRIEDNWGLSFFGKIRLNDFVNELEEMPTAEFHWTGQSFFDDRLTFYSDSQASRFRQRYADDTSLGSERFFTFTTTRNEVDLPFSVGRTKVVPFIAGTVAYEDGLGFYKELDGGTGAREDEVWLGEAGVRVTPQPFWKVFPNVKSKLWDINKLRHIIQPRLTAVGYTESNSVIEQRDTLSVGISQRLQTKRGSGDNMRAVDWMRLDLDVTWVNNSGDASAGPDQFIWNKPFIPLVNGFSETIPQADRRGSVIYGPRRNYFEADYLWRMSDTTALLSDMNYDMQSGVVQQYNVGFSHMRWPNLSYYIGSRYLRRVENNYGEKGSNAFTCAFTYLLDPRYSLVYSGQFDFDYDATVRSDITLIRRYHRLCWSVTYSTDASLDRQAVVFSLWPQGMSDLAIGPSRYMGLGGSAGF